MRIPRHDNNLNDAIEALDLVLEQAKGSVADAWDLLSADELSFIDKEIESCVTDRRYYLENYHTIRDEHGRVQTLYPFWDHQEMIFEALMKEWEEFGCFRGIILKPRQCGGTTWSGGILFHATIFTEQAYSISMAHDDDASAEIARRLFDAYAALPWWLKPEFASKQMERHVIFQRADDKKRNLDPGLGSTLIISNAQKGAGVAIGRTIRSGHFSEVSRWPSAEVWTADIEPSLNARDMLAIMESTAWGRNGLFYNMWKAAENGKEGSWTPIFIPVYKVRKYYLPLRKGEIINLSDDERGLRDKVKGQENFTIPLGFFKWRRKKIAATENATGSDETHYESYPVTSGEAFINSGLCAFPKKGLNYQERVNCKPPKLIGEIQMAGDYRQSIAERLELPPALNLHEPSDEELLEKPEYVDRFWIWEEPDENEGVEYYISSDVASGDGGDYTTAIVYKIGYGREPHVQVAGWHGLIDASAWAYVLAAMGMWYHTAEIAVEYNGFGVTTGNDLFKVIDYPNLYRWKKHDRIAASDTTLMHWQTTSKTRPDAISRMFQALVDKSVVLRDKHLIEEMRDFARYEGETKIAGIDNNDDMCMAAIIGLCALYEKITMSGSWSDNALGTQSSQHVMPKVPVVFAVFDHMGRQVQQVDSQAEGDKIIKSMSDKHKMDFSKYWKVIPIAVTKANTIWSPIFDGSGAEHELYDRHNMDPKDIRPDIVYSYKQMLTHQSAGEYEDD